MKYVLVVPEKKSDLIIKILVVIAFVATVGFIAGLFWSEVDSVRQYRDALDSLNATLDVIGAR